MWGLIRYGEYHIAVRHRGGLSGTYRLAVSADSEAELWCGGESDLALNDITAAGAVQLQLKHNHQQQHQRTGTCIVYVFGPETVQ